MDAAAGCQSSYSLLPILLRSKSRVFLYDRYGAKEPSHRSFRLLALVSNDVSIAQHRQESAEDKAGKLGHLCRPNSSPEMPFVFTLARRIYSEAGANCDASKLS